MILLNKNASNNVVVTLGEKISTFSHVVFEFQNYQSKKIQTVGFTSLTSGVTINDRCYKFGFTAQGITGMADGYWDYTVFGTTASFSMTGPSGSQYIDTTGMTSLEIGKAYVTPTPETIVTYDSTDNVVVYEQ